MTEVDSQGVALATSGLAAAAVLQALLRTTPGFVVVIGLDGLVVAANRLAKGLAVHNVIGQSVFDLLGSARRALLESTLLEVARSGEPSELELDSPDSGPYELRIGPVILEQRVVAYVLEGNNVSSRRGIELELRESQDKLRIALAASKLGLWSWDSASNMVQWDPGATLLIFGLTSGVGSYEGFLELVHPDDRDMVARHVELALEVSAYPDLEYRIVRPNGEERWVLSRAEVFKEQGGAVTRMVGGILDISERRLMEEKLRQAQKMEALGELTAGLAHNFNNALMAILPNLEHALRSATPQAAPLLQVARKAAERAARLVSELMVFAGGHRARQRRDEALDVVVQRALDICRSTFSKQIAVELVVSGDAPVMSMDSAQLEHAVINVCINARDALDDVSGRIPTLRVAISRVPAGSAELSASLKPHQEHARVSISDNGVGMAPDVQQRVFEPFFTTKDIGKGTGLGLSTTYAIVREHGGSVVCESQANVGTTFHLYLPVERSGRRKDSGTLSLPAPDGSELVLLVDDDPVVRAVTARVLKGAGYEILEASDGGEGLAIFEQHGSRIALVLLDESMPGVAGHQVLARILALAPTAKVAMFTGVQPKPDLLRGARGLVRKPIGANDLLWRVRELLEE